MRRLVYSVGLLAIWWVGASLLAAAIASSETPQTETDIPPESVQTAAAVPVFSPLPVTRPQITCAVRSIVSRLPELLTWVRGRWDEPWTYMTITAHGLIYACLSDQYLQDQRNTVGFTSDGTRGTRIPVGQQSR